MMQHRFLVLISAATALLASQGASAQLLSGNAVNASTGDWEFRIGPVFSQSKNIGFDGGSSADIDSATGVKIGIGWYVMPQLALGLDFNWAQSDFNGTVQGDHATSHIENGHLDISTVMFNGTYTFLDGPIKPLVEAGLGWNGINTNIASGPPQTGCWWDPWWGYICSGYQPTHSASSFAWMAGAGVQFNFSPRFAVNADYRYTQIELHNATSAPGIGSFGLTFVWRFTEGY